MKITSSVRWFGVALLALTLVALLAACGGGPPTVNGVTMATGTQGDNKDPVGATNSFPASTGVFHAVVAVSNLASSSKLTAQWSVVDAGSAATPGQQITSTDITTDGTRNVDFTLTPNNGQLPPGTYKVDILLNGQQAATQQFTVASQ